jgi:hypothetical protein
MALHQDVDENHGVGRSTTHAISRILNRYIHTKQR